MFNATQYRVKPNTFTRWGPPYLLRQVGPLSVRCGDIKLSDGGVDPQIRKFQVDRVRG